MQLTNKRISYTVKETGNTYSLNGEVTITEGARISSFNGSFLIEENNYIGNFNYSEGEDGKVDKHIYSIDKNYQADCCDFLDNVIETLKLQSE